MIEATAPIARDDDFVEHITEVLDHGALAVMLSLGHRAGLLDLMKDRAPSTSEAIATAGGYAERYVREWLAVMVTGGIVTYEPRTHTYHLPAMHAACLTAEAPLGNLAVNARFIVMLSEMQDRLLEVFRTGAGIEYDEYSCFHEIMAEDSGQTVVAGIEETLANLVPDVVARLRAGIEVLDAGCGAGRALLKLAGLFPASCFTGYDLCPDAVAMAQAAADAGGLHNCSFEVRDLSKLEQSAAFDLITSFDAIHDTKDPAHLLCAIARALKPGGVHLMQDIGGSAALEKNLDFPFASLLYAISCTHCTPVSLAQGGAGLGTMWGWETALEMLNAAGYNDIARHTLPHDPMNVWFVNRKGAIQ